METSRLTVRVPRDVLERAKRYARENRTTLSRLVSEYLRQLTTPDDPLVDAPIVRRLSGTLSQDVSVEDYREHLERRHGREV
jgi:hypothetical protein